MVIFDKIRRLLTLHKRKQVSPADYSRPILNQTEANQLLFSRVKSGEPFMASRLGSSELNCLRHYLFHRQGGRHPYPVTTAAVMGTSAGLFPLTDAALDEFCRVYLDGISQADAMGIWYYHDENRVLATVSPHAVLIQPRALEPYYHSEPWSRALNGKQVLVIHPFAESIREQFENKRTLLFDNQEILPAFRLHTIKAVQSIAGEPTGFATWFDALESMKNAMDAIEYDIGIIGAGAYGLPLAAYAKQSGKSAIHMGGATQILFGIKGRRWDDHDVISNLYNNFWIRPKQSETPQRCNSVEDGCYW